MKSIILILITFLSLNVFSQEYPKIEIDSIGNKYVVFTYEQAQKIDNAYELLLLLEKASADCDSLSLSYVKVINKLENQVKLLETDLILYKGQVIDKDSQISNLSQRLKDCETGNKLCDEQIEVRNKQLELLNDEIKTLKTKRNVAYGVGIGGVILGVIIAILVN